MWQLNNDNVNWTGELFKLKSILQITRQFLVMSEFSINKIFTEVRDLFRKWRENNERNSEDVIELWEAILEDKCHKLGNESEMRFEVLVR